MSWNEERISELNRLWEAGYSASAIGKALGVSKNAVIGKAHRLKLRARPSPIKRGAPVAKRPLAPVVRPRVAEPPPPPPRLPRPPVEASGGPRCLWPIGDPSHKDFHFCDAAAVPGKSYCAEHCARAYISRNRADTQAA